MRRFIVILLAWLITTGVGFSQCAMCKQALTKSEEGQRLVSGMNAGILFLLAVPFALVGTFGLLIYRAHRRQSVRQAPPPTDNLPTSEASAVTQLSRQSAG